MKYDCIVVISIVLLVIPCTGKIYPVPYKVEGEKIFFTRCYVEVKEVPFSKDDSRDKFLLDYLHALKVKDPDLANSFYEPEYRLGTEDEKLIKRWKEEPTPEIDTILKYSFNGYDVYYVGTRHGGTYSPCRLQGVDNARFSLRPHAYNSTAIIGAALKPVLRGESKAQQIDVSAMSAIPLGSNDIANVYFQFRGPEESITRTLKEAEDELERAYQSKDLDALSGRVDKWSLERMSRALQEGIIIIGENVGSYEPIGVLDMDPIYIYTGYRKDKGTIVLRTYLKLEDTYTRINYGFSGYGIDSFLQSVEFKSFITGKLK